MRAVRADFVSCLCTCAELDNVAPTANVFPNIPRHYIKQMRFSDFIQKILTKSQYISKKSSNLSLHLDFPDHISTSAPSRSPVHALASPPSSCTSQFCLPSCLFLSLLLCPVTRGAAPRLNPVIFSPVSVWPSEREGPCEEETP